jgi:hypothetical protein
MTTTIEEQTRVLLIQDLQRHAQTRRELHKRELTCARRWARIDLLVGVGTILAAAGAAVTVWPSGIAFWIPGILAAVTALLASARSVLDPAKVRAGHVERATSLDWSAERLDRLATDVGRGVISDDAAWQKHDDLVAEGEKWESEASCG